MERYNGQSTNRSNGYPSLTSREAQPEHGMGGCEKKRMILSTMTG